MSTSTLNDRIPSPSLLNQMLTEVDTSLLNQLRSNLNTYPLFLKASDVLEIVAVAMITTSAILSYFGQSYPEYHISLYAGIASTLSLSSSIASRYLNREAHEREDRINTILHSLQRDRPPVHLGITVSNG